MHITKFVFLIALSANLGTGVLAQDGIVSIDNVTNAISPYQLYAGATHQVSIRYNLITNQPPGDPPVYWWASNGFEIYSPDGADWGFLQGATGPLVVTAGARGDLSIFLKHFYFDGSIWSETGESGLDPAPGSGGVNTRAGFYLATIDVFVSSGYIGGLDNDIALTLEFESFLEDDGLHLCIDTCNQITAWEWTNGDEDFPVWDNGLGGNGPRCWSVGAWVPMLPEWCEMEDALAIGYCHQASYWLCAIDEDGPAPLTYSLIPPYDNGDYGSVDPSTGHWTWLGSTMQPGAYDIEFQVNDGMDYAMSPFVLHVLVNEAGCDCCVGRVGDANNSGEDEPTISDVSVLIDHLFITRAPLACYPESDINQSGGSYPHTEDITIGDISILIDYLFITGPSLGLPDCL